MSFCDNYYNKVKIEELKNSEWLPHKPTIITGQLDAFNSCNKSLCSCRKLIYRID